MSAFAGAASRVQQLQPKLIVHRAPDRRHDTLRSSTRCTPVGTRRPHVSPLLHGSCSAFARNRAHCREHGRQCFALRDAVVRWPYAHGLLPFALITSSCHLRRLDLQPPPPSPPFCGLAYNRSTIPTRGTAAHHPRRGGGFPVFRARPRIPDLECSRWSAIRVASVGAGLGLLAVDQGTLFPCHAGSAGVAIAIMRARSHGRAGAALAAIDPIWSSRACSGSPHGLPPSSVEQNPRGGASEPACRPPARYCAPT